MIALTLTIACLSGYILTARQFLSIPLRFAPFFSVCLIGICLFISAICGYLQEGAFLLIYCGYGLLIVSMFFRFFAPKNNIIKIDPSQYFLFVLLIIIGYIYCLNMPFSVIDDYVYWGIMGKYLHINNHLPDNQTSIMARHLAYTPGPSLFHYFYYQLFNQYSPAISYFAQSCLFFSALFVLSGPKKTKNTIFTVCLAIIILTLQFGSVMAKLSTDYLLATYFFAICWIIFSKENNRIKLLVIAPSLVHLYLLKQIGLMLSFVLLVIAICYFFSTPANTTRKQIITSAIFLATTAAGLILTKMAWGSYCQTMGFSQVINPMNKENIINNLLIFSDEKTWQGFKIFLKSIFFGEADRLKLPYILWYALVFFLWHRVLKSRPYHIKKQYKTTLSISLFFFLLYLLMLYLMQMIVFGLGTNFDHAPGLTRYINIFFGGIVLFSVATYFLRHHFAQNNISTKWTVATTILFGLLLILSRNQRVDLDQPDINSQKIAKQIQQAITITPSTTVCVVPPTGDKLLELRLLYYLQPGRVSYSSLPSNNPTNLYNALKNYDFCLIQKPNKTMSKWLQDISDSSIVPDSLYRISANNAENIDSGKPITLMRVF